MSTRDVQSTVDTTFSENSVHIERLCYPSECLGSQVLAIKIALHQVIRRFAYGNRIGLSQSFNARSNVGYFSQCQLFLTTYSTHRTDNNQTRMNAYTDGELDTLRLLQTFVQVAH